jgi:hypothetical protein
MASWDDVRTIALALPGVEEALSRDLTVWKAGRMFAGERPLRVKEVAEIGPVDEPILLVRVESEADKFALIEEDPELFFTVSHFDGYPMVLVRLERLDRGRLVELVESAWATVAPASAVARHFGGDDS